MIAIKLRIKINAIQRFHHRAAVRAQRLLWNVIIAPADHAKSELYRELRDQGMDSKAITAAVKAAYPPGQMEKALTAWMNDSPHCWALRAFNLKAAGHKLGRTAAEAKSSAIKRAATLKKQGASPQEIAKCATLKPKPKYYLTEAALRFQASNKPLAKMVDPERRTVTLPHFGTVRYRDESRVLRRVLQESPEVTVDTVRVARRGKHYFAILLAKHEFADAPAPEGVIGVDRGVAIPLCGSDGEAYGARMKRRVLKLQRRIERIQRHKDKKQKPGSIRFKRSQKQIAKLKARQANIRENEQHLGARDIASKARVVAIEDLRLKHMSASAAGTVEAPGKNVKQKSGLNRELLAQGLSAWAEKIERHVKRRGGEVVEVRAAYTSQRCPECGHTSADNRRSQARFTCTNCGFAANADIVGAVNVAGTVVQSQFGNGLANDGNVVAGTGGDASYARGVMDTGLVGSNAGQENGRTMKREPIAIEWVQGTRAIGNLGSVNALRRKRRRRLASVVRSGEVRAMAEKTSVRTAACTPTAAVP